jgi:DNA polymerase-3 subunit gamma/tau
MENFIVSARKYRPAMFNTVVGQSSITNTLKNAIKNNQLAQAFLFCGPRGVGKTTCARILAKTINCFNKTPDGEACNQCESCVSFNNGQSLNIYELDAASNNSVDDIRSLIEQVRFAPQLGKYKVYIIDEVHMLSQAAFNAFLKTLEEPPSHAIFILATTEKHKILPTILSRCQKFDFNRITVDDISKHLAEIAQKESITAEPDALHIIAAKADGGLRDALSMFDQLVSFSGGHSLTYQSVIENLHILDYEYYFKVGDCMQKGDIPAILLLFNDILSNGFDGLQFIAGLSEHFRNLLVCKDPQTVKLLEVGENIKSKYLQQAGLIPQDILLKGIGICTKTEIGFKASKNQRLLVEYALLQIVSLMHQPNGDEKKNDQLVIIDNSGASLNPQPTLKKEPIVVPPSKLENQVVKLQEKFTTAVKVQEAPGMPIIELEKGTQKIPQKNFTTGISINQFINPAKENQLQEPQPKVKLPEEAFTPEHFNIVWNKFVTLMQNQMRFSVVNALTTTKPLIEGSNITHTVGNKIQLNEIEELRDTLVPYLRKELNNYSVALIVNINEEVIKTKAYTPQDRYAKLVQKNPLLALLKQKLDLDLEF